MNEASLVLEVRLNCLVVDKYSSEGISALE